MLQNHLIHFRLQLFGGKLRPLFRLFDQLLLLQFQLFPFQTNRMLDGVELGEARFQISLPRYVCSRVSDGLLKLSPT